MKTVNSRYPLVQMSQFLHLRKEFFTIDDAAMYQLVTVQLHSAGHPGAATTHWGRDQDQAAAAHPDG